MPNFEPSFARRHYFIPIYPDISPNGVSRETLQARSASQFSIAHSLFLACGNFLPVLRLRTRPKTRKAGLVGDIHP